MNQETKVCTKCQIEKPKTAFYKDYRYNNGSVRAKCKNCMDSLNVEWAKTTEGKKSTKKATRKYISSEYGKKKQHDYYKSPKGQLAHKKADINFRNSTYGKSFCLARNAKYRAMKLKATPKWLTKDHLELIKMSYQLAGYLTKETEIPHEVDHIIPLKGKEVCGLHVPWNLRVIPEEENNRKRNKIL